MKTTYSLAMAALSAAVLTACGSGGDVSSGPTIDLSTARGTIVANSPAVLAAFPTAADYTAVLSASASGRGLLGAAGAPKCGVTFHYMQYNTVGGANEPTNASAGIMVPSGTDAACTGPRPVLLYAHGTTVEKNYNFASPANSETALIAAMYAAQGFIVVGSSYAGYESSTLPYHPYLNGEQQSNDMIDALRAARKAFPTIGANASNKLFISGYSQGGHVAMATMKAMQSPTYSGEFSVTALGAMAGPYSMVKTVQTIFAGGVNAGATVFAPLIFTSWQKSYGNMYTSPSEAYEAAYATGIESLLPTATLTFNGLFTSGKLPPYLFASGPLVTADPGLNALFAAGVGTPNLIKQSYRQTILTTPTHPLWAAAAKNDLTLGWTPTRPVSMCTGAADPTVYATNMADAATAFSTRGAGALVRVFDVENAATVGPALAGAFAAAKAATAADPAAPGASPAEKVVQAYHGGLVPPFCNIATRGFFQSVLAAGQ
ncbi:MAG: alpha/beta hydrolase [Betaproteobacteria bacterium]|nr:MAG: alpha/beta hydrolase [Betaproteobacteria bacterium]